jgi:lipoyl(octanoyl) transferase
MSDWNRTDNQRYESDENVMPSQVFVHSLGRMPYRVAWDLQEDWLSRAARRKQEARENGKVLSPPIVQHLLLVEHPPVFTLGKSGKEEHLLLNELEREEAGVEWVHTNRGGDITFHGPGQLVVYPLLDLEAIRPDIHWYMRSLEEAVIRTLAHWHISAERYPGYTGVWIDATHPHRARKICAMGVRTSRWLTLHGLALNVSTDLGYFSGIVPCGISSHGVCSLQSELQKTPSISDVSRVFIRQFSSVFNCRMNGGALAIQNFPKASRQSVQSLPVA